MSQINSFSQIDNEERRAASARLRRVRRIAARHGLGVVSSFGALTIVTTMTDRPRSVHGLIGVPLEEIEKALPPQLPAKHDLTKRELYREIERLMRETRPLEPQLAAGE